MLWVSSFLFLLFLSMISMLFLQEVWVMEWDLLHNTFVHLSATIIFDFFSFLFFSVVLVIASMIFFFSQYYMDSEKNFKGFLFLLFLFVTSMVCLIFSPNLVFLLLGWDGLGVVSYLLVVFYSNYSSSVAGMVTFLLNRLGDVFFFLSISFFFFLIDWNFMEMHFFFFFLSFVMILTFITKSAQIPFSSWLPAAMAAPTPVSSLVHSSTLVTAGVFLFIRFYKLFSFNMFWLLFISVVTLVMAGVMANFDWDLKKIIAFSTLSQLGFMVSSFSCGLILFTFFHLLTHALFKASLFMCSGVLIHSSDNNQDFRNSAVFVGVFPFLSMAVVVCLLCLCGFPFSSGFLSKDFILDGANLSVSVFLFFLLGVVLTFSYSLRFSFYSMLSSMKHRMKVMNYYENLFYLLVPIWLLILLALLSGFLWSELIFLFSNLSLVTSGWKFAYWSIVVLAVNLVFFLFHSYYFFLKKYFLSTMWFLNRIFTSWFTKIVLIFSKKLIGVLDHGWMEKLGPSGILGLSTSMSYFILRQLNFSFFIFFFFFLFFLMF